MMDYNTINITGNDRNDITTDKITEFLPEVEKSRAIVSASFSPIDIEVIEKSKKPKIIILAEGLDQYKNENFNPKEDLIISEYPNNVKLNDKRNLQRNRLVATIADSQIVMSSRENDNYINNSVSNFLNLGKDIFCFPGSGKEDEGNLELIKQGANLITKIKDLSH